MSNLPCPFRFNERQSGESTVATCGLIQQVLRVETTDLCEVPSEACEACRGAALAGGAFQNDVFPSLLHGAAVKFLKCVDVDSESRHRVEELVEATEQLIVDESFGLPAAYPSCDVYLCCADASEVTRRSIESVLQQENVEVILHLILVTAAAEALLDDFHGNRKVQIHRFDRPIDLFRAVHTLAPDASSRFIALQDCNSISLPGRIAGILSQLQNCGGDFAGSSLITPTELINVAEPSSGFEHSLPWPTLIFRRASFIDLGGFADRSGDEADELLHRAARSGKAVVAVSQPSVRRLEDWIPPVLGADLQSESESESELKSVRHQGAGYSMENVQCDVVVPIYGQLEYVAEAIQSVIEQEGAEAIVHLIDDQSPQCTHQLFRFWGTHPRVRLYRNSKNIGQYASFNNVSEFFETELAAVQDGDDVSLPNRLHHSGNLLRLCDGDFFAATMKVFGDEKLIQSSIGEPSVRKSSYPRPSGDLNFAMNPTTCFRVEMFRRLGGYASFGRQVRNGLDSEFMIRAYHAGVPFVISSEIVTKYRVHAQAATRRKDTGFGSEPRKRALEECRRRKKVFSSGAFDARSFGAIRMHRGITQRIGPAVSEFD